MLFRSIVVAVDGKRAGEAPITARVKPGSREVRFTRLDDDVDLKCTVSVPDTGRTVEIDAKKPTCPH